MQLELTDVDINVKEYMPFFPFKRIDDIPNIKC